MNTLQQLFFLYPNAVTVVVIMIALLVIYLAGKALALVFSSTEKKVEPEPSIMTELDELRRSNEHINTLYDQLSYDHKILGREYDEYKSDAQEVHNKLTKLYESEQTIRNNISSQLWHSRREVAKLKRDLVKATMQIAELGDKYSSSDRERGEYESMYNSILAQYAELKVKLKAIEQSK